jgi:hypothetical protein
MILDAGVDDMRVASKGLERSVKSSFDSTPTLTCVSFSAQARVDNEAAFVLVRSKGHFETYRLYHRRRPSHG